MIPSPPRSQPGPGPARPAPPRRSSGVVVPAPLRWSRRLAATLVYLLIEAVAGTLRWRWHIHPAVRALARQPLIFALWHNRLPLSLVMYRRFVRAHQRPGRMAAMVSASRDGGVVARVLEHFGVQPVRGSTSRRGPQALLELTTWAERGCDLALTPDGPRGPCYVVQPGVIALARLTGLPVVPVSCRLPWKIRLKSWDRFQIPLPFGRADIELGEPLQVPADAPEAELEPLRAELERRLRALTVD